MTDCAQDLLPTLVEQNNVAHLVLRDSARRNALDAQALRVLESHCLTARALVEQGAVDVVVLKSERGAFCSGFDLASCAEVPTRVEELLVRLSACVRALRALDAPLVAQVEGAALAGGCALLTACDFVVVSADAQLGYPTHRIGISPAISIPTLFARMGPRTRALLMSNELLTGSEAYARGLATHCVESPALLESAVESLVASLSAKGPQAMRATKQWMRRIEECGSGELASTRGCDDEAMNAALEASVALASGDEFARMLRAFWASRSKVR